MPSARTHAHSERQQTDESLRIERDKADSTLEELAAIDEVADAVINLARARADEVLAAARAGTDRGSAVEVPLSQPPEAVKKVQAMEDRVLREERSDADVTLREERAERTALLSREREDTDQDLSNERARSDDAIATRDRFLGIVSHDLRDLVNVIVGCSELIARDVSREHHEMDVLTHAKRIQRSGAQMNRLVGDLVDVASIEAGALAVTREVGDPTPVVMEAVDSFQQYASASGVSLVTEIVLPLPVVAFDPARILQVLTNLLSNAIKFTPAHGTVVVRVEHIADDIRFAVIDTGVGISGDRLEDVFLPFLQVARKDRRGVGLGLYICKCIVQGHGGRIWAERRSGPGTTFCFLLPIQVAP